ncbi:MAG: orotate phosphoribosyltransferase [Candidatus Methylomirabilales bacterium]
MPWEVEGGVVEKDEKRLLKLIRERSYRYSPEAPFQLSSGRVSPHYVDLRALLCMPEALVVTGKIIFARIKQFERQAHTKVQAIGGPAEGAIPIASAVACYSYEVGDPIETFFVRKEPKIHGLRKWVEGHSRVGSNVVVVDDVVTTGGSTLKAIHAAEEHGFKVVKIIVLVDRLEGGKEKLSGLGVPYEAVFTLHEITAISS